MAKRMLAMDMMSRIKTEKNWPYIETLLLEVANAGDEKAAPHLIALYDLLYNITKDEKFQQGSNYWKACQKKQLKNCKGKALL